MEKAIWKLFLIAGSMALLFSGVELAFACPDDLICGNFTDYDKINDCEYVTEQDLEYEEEQSVLCGLWEQSYSYEGDVYSYQTQNIEVEFTPEENEIDNSSFILASKIFFFGLFNYFVFSYLTKSGFILKCLTALS